jgi:hypothetical protein
MRLAVVGSRDFVRIDRVYEYLDRFAYLNCIVSGGARGVDHEAEQWADDNGIPVVSFRPDRDYDGLWGVHRLSWACDADYGETVDLGQRYPSFAAAAHTRNGYIVDFCTSLVAFWDGKSKGTEATIQKASAAGKLREVVRA